jgi:hypothetical protein
MWIFRFIILVEVLLLSCGNNSSSKSKTEQHPNSMGYVRETESVQNSAIRFDEKKYYGIIDTIMAGFIGFEFCDSVSVNIDNDDSRIYLLFIKTKDVQSDKEDIYTEINGIVLAYRYKNNKLTILDRNESLMKNDSYIENHSLVNDGDSLLCLQLGYGPDLRNTVDVYFSLTLEGVFVDSVVFSRKVNDGDNIYFEFSSIAKNDLVKNLRLKDLTYDLLHRHKRVYARRRPTTDDAMDMLKTIFGYKVRYNKTFDYGDKTQTSRYFSSDMVELLYLEDRCRIEKGKVCRLNWDFLCDCQNHTDTISAKFEIKSTNPVQILLTITDLGQIRKIRYDFVEEDWSFKISDVIVDGRKSLKEILQSPL